MSMQAKREHNNLKYGCGYWFGHASTTAQRMAVGTLSLSATSHVSASQRVSESSDNEQPTEFSD